ncbi:uncharacterized protein LOC126778058 [Nymphalis io]|uniref:uncharacterized protein LOC126778058 n=1 Tax=Inachis io TaxID=171585 RepID=UPI0021678F6C|nr:uncharacterized protein LOC126778058 [Nymphalis io]
MEKQDDDEEFGAAITIGSETTEAEKEFERILEQLREAEGLKLYADVYTKLYDSYFKMKEENVAHQEKLTSLKNRLARYDAMVSEYLTEISDSSKTVDRLRGEIDDARALADAMHARELASVESLETMKKTVARLEKELDARKRAGDDDAGATSAVKEKEKFEKEKARLQGELDGVKQRLTNALSYIEELDQKNTIAEETIGKMEEQLEPDSGQTDMFIIEKTRKDKALLANFDTNIWYSDEDHGEDDEDN